MARKPTKAPAKPGSAAAAEPTKPGPEGAQAPAKPGTHYRVIPPGKAAIVEGSVDWPREPGYEAISALVTPLIGGGDIEHVSVLNEGHRRDLFVDENGIAKGLPVNERATAIYREHWLTNHPGADPSDLAAIYGTAVLFMRRVWF